MTRPALTSLNRAPVFFAHAGRSAYDAGEGYLTACAICRREVTAPWSMQRACIWCLYCGMERGHVPLIEVLGCEFSCGITADECGEIRRWPKDRDIDDLFMCWMRKHGHILFEIGF